MILEAMTRQGWQVLRGLPTSYGSVACLLSGPGGAFAVEARTQPGRGRVSTVPTAWLRQAASQAEAAERWLGAEVVPLLVLRHAELDHSGAERDGVVVVAASELARVLRSTGRAHADRDHHVAA